MRRPYQTTHTSPPPCPMQLPAPLGRLTCLEDLVLSDNNLQAARLSVSCGWLKKRGQGPGACP